MVTTQTDYQALTTGAALHPRPATGLLVLTDADRSDFLHRMTTNNINALKPGQAAVTVLTTPTARIAFVFTVICRENELWLLPAEGETAALSKHLRGQIFFMDKVKVREESVAYRVLRVMGPQAEARLHEAGLAHPAADHTWQEQDGTLILKQLAYDVPGFVLVVPTAQADSMLARLSDLGAVTVQDNAAYHTRRVELGRPLPGHELTGDYNPLEAGLAWACADNKGCYTGQEIIARQITYDKVTKHLVGLTSPTLLTPGAVLQAEGREAGVVTSVAHSPALDQPIALAVVKRAYAEGGQQLSAENVLAKVVKLPLS
jgi:tRNA-modifying protein YgfZ